MTSTCDRRAGSAARATTCGDAAPPGSRCLEEEARGQVVSHRKSRAATSATTRRSRPGSPSGPARRSQASPRTITSSMPSLRCLSGSSSENACSQPGRGVQREERPGQEGHRQHQEVGRVHRALLGLGDRTGQQPDGHEAQRADHEQRHAHPPGTGEGETEERRADAEEDRHLGQRDRDGDRDPRPDDRAGARRVRAGAGAAACSAASPAGSRRPRTPRSSRPPSRAARACTYWIGSSDSSSTDSTRRRYAGGRPVAATLLPSTKARRAPWVIAAAPGRSGCSARPARRPASRPPRRRRPCGPRRAPRPRSSVGVTSKVSSKACRAPAGQLVEQRHVTDLDHVDRGLRLVAEQAAEEHEEHQREDDGEEDRRPVAHEAAQDRHGRSPRSADGPALMRGTPVR